MVDIVAKKAGALDPVAYNKDLILVASDPSVPEGLTKRSFRITAGDIRPSITEWSPSTVALSALVNVKSGDYLVVTGNSVIIAGVLVAAGDTVHVIDFAGGVIQVTPHNVARKQRSVMVNAQFSPYTPDANTIAYVDTTDGPVTINLPLLHAPDDVISIIPLAATYSLHPLTIHTTEPISGVVEDVLVSVDNLSIDCRRIDDTYGWLLARA